MAKRIFVFDSEDCSKYTITAYVDCLKAWTLKLHKAMHCIFCAAEIEVNGHERWTEQVTVKTYQVPFLFIKSDEMWRPLEEDATFRQTLQV